MYRNEATPGGQNKIVKRTTEVTGVDEIAKRMEEFPTSIRRCWYEAYIRERMIYLGGSIPVTASHNKRDLHKFGDINNFPEPNNIGLLIEVREKPGLVTMLNLMLVLGESLNKQNNEAIKRDRETPFSEVQSTRNDYSARSRVFCCQREHPT